MPYLDSIAALLDELGTLLGADRARAADEAFVARATSWSPAALKARQAGKEAFAAVVATPENATEVSTLIIWANRSSARIVPIGGGSSTVGDGDNYARPIVYLDTSALASIAFDETSLTVTAGAGVILADLEERLNAHEYTLGSLPQSARIATVGGAVATEAFGSFAAGYGGMRDRVTALEAVLPSGEPIQTTASGAAGRTLHHLLIGTAGAFGVVTAATLAIRPLPEVRAWCAFTFARWSDATDALRLVFRSDAHPAAVRLFDPAAAKEQFGGAATAGSSVLLLGFEGSELVQTGQYQTAYAVCKQIGGADAASIDGDAWFDAERFRTSAFAANGRPGGLADVISLYVSWPSLTAAYETLTGALMPLCRQVSAQVGFADAQGAALDIRFEAEASDAVAALALYQKILETARTAAVEYADVHIAHHYGIGDTRAEWARAERGEAHLAALRSLKSALDPRSVLPELR